MNKKLFIHNKCDLNHKLFENILISNSNDSFNDGNLSKIL